MLVNCTFSHVLYNLLLGRGPTVAFPLVCGCKDRLCWDICPAKIGWCTLHGAARCSLGPAPTGRNFIICGHLIWRAISSISTISPPAFSPSGITGGCCCGLDPGLHHREYYKRGKLTWTILDINLLILYFCPSYRDIQ